MMALIITPKAISGPFSTRTTRAIAVVASRPFPVTSLTSAASASQQRATSTPSSMGYLIWLGGPTIARAGINTTAMLACTPSEKRRRAWRLLPTVIADGGCTSRAMSAGRNHSQAIDRRLAGSVGQR